MPYESDEIDWVDVARYISAIRERREQAGRDKFYDYAMLVNIYHTEKPDRLYSRLAAYAKAETTDDADDEVGDMAKLRRLKYSREKVRTNGGGG